MTKAEVARWVQRVVDLPPVALVLRGRGRPPVDLRVRYERGREDGAVSGSVYPDRSEMHLTLPADHETRPERLLTLVTHEVAHMVADDAECHGAGWRAAWCGVVGALVDRDLQWPQHANGRRLAYPAAWRVFEHEIRTAMRRPKRSRPKAFVQE